MTMQEDLVALARIKQQIAELDEARHEIEAALIGALEAKGQKTVSNGDVTGTLVKGTRITIDAEKLKKSLGAATWKKVTKQVLDQERLEAHIVTGDVDANVVAAASTEKDVRPYIKVTGTIRPVAKNSGGGTKPAAKKRVVRRPKKTV